MFGLRKPKKMRTAAGALLLAASVALVGCSPAARQAQGFRLPEGDAEKGKEAFIALKCNTCHSVSGVELPPAASPGQHQVVLGGEVIKVRTYGDLVTAVIHPAYTITKSFDRSKTGSESSPMPQFNDTMTVRQLIDIVAFLHGQYKERPLDVYDYGP